MSGAIPPLPQYAFMEWCSITAQGRLNHNNDNLKMFMTWFRFSVPPQLQCTAVSLCSIYKGRMKSLWSGGCAAVMQREAVTVMPSCSGGGNVVVTRSSSLQPSLNLS
jgi:hypothetical protein